MLQSNFLAVYYLPLPHINRCDSTEISKYFLVCFLFSAVSNVSKFYIIKVSFNRKFYNLYFPAELKHRKILLLEPHGNFHICYILLSHNSVYVQVLEYCYNKV